MRLTKKVLIDQETAPSRDFGVDYGSEGKILVRTKKYILVWRRPGTVWSGIGNPHSYVPAYLHVILTPEAKARGEKSYAAIFSKDLIDGGRLTRDRLAKVMSKVKRDMELDTLSVSEIDLKKTLVIK